MKGDIIQAVTVSLCVNGALLLGILFGAITIWGR